MARRTSSIEVQKLFYLASRKRQRNSCFPCLAHAHALVNDIYSDNDGRHSRRRREQQQTQSYSSIAVSTRRCNGIVSSTRPSFFESQNNAGLIQTRSMSWLPEVIQDFSIWGGSGFLVKTLHGSEGQFLPYAGCFAAISILVRTALFPVVLNGAKTAARFAKVVPEIQFLLTLFGNDSKKLREKKASALERWALMRTNLSSLGGIYKLHNIHPFAVFLSPLLQFPIFLYVSTDLRKIVNGLDPILAQQLVESSLLWIPDLTEPDPWYGLPIIAGVLLYWNVEMAIGKRSLAGATSAKSDSSVLLKDIFQSVAVFMPCFTSQLPAGVQIYIVSSFVFTLVQSKALRTESFRQAFGLPSMLAPPPEAKYAQEFVELKKLEQKAREIRGDGPVLGKGVLALDYEVSFPGEYRKSTIEGSGIAHEPVPSSPEVLERPIKASAPPKPTFPFIQGVSAPPWQLEEQANMLKEEATVEAADEREYMPQYDDEVMEKANRGELPRPTQFVDGSDKVAPPSKLSMKRFNKQNKKKPYKRKGRR